MTSGCSHFLCSIAHLPHEFCQKVLLPWVWNFVNVIALGIRPDSKHHDALWAAGAPSQASSLDPSTTWGYSLVDSGRFNAVHTSILVVLIQFKHVLSMLNRCFGLPSGGFCFFVFHGKAMLPCLRAADVDGHKKRQIEKPVWKKWLIGWPWHCG